MQAILLYAVTAAVFLVVDAVGLRFVLGPFFRERLGDWLLDTPRLGPAAAFYLFYVLALTVLVTAPRLADGDLLRTAGLAALFGAAAYGTYEFTNLATLSRWTWSMVALDLAWGTALTAGSAIAGVLAARALA